MKPLNERGATNPVLSIMYSCGLGILGGLFLFASLSKVLDFQQFLQGLALYGIRSHTWQELTGIAVIFLEVILGTWVLLGQRVKLPLQGALALLLLFALETSIHWSALKGASCGCFGPLSSDGPGASLLHQSLALLIVSGLFLVNHHFPRLREQGRGLRTGVGILAVTAGILYGFIIHPPSSIAQVGDANGIQVRAVLSASCSHCREVAKEVGLLQKQIDSSKFTIYLGAQTSEEIDDFIRTSGANLTYVPVTFRQLQSMSTSVPAIQIVVHGEIVRNWVGEMPSAAEVRTALNASVAKTSELQN